MRPLSPSPQRRHNVDYPYLSGAVIMFAGFLVGLKWLAAPEEPDMPEEEPAGTDTAFIQKKR